MKHRKKLAERLILRQTYGMSEPVPSPYLPLQIVFEDEWLVAFNKPAGLLVHGNPPRAGQIHNHPPEDLPNLEDLASLGRKRRLTLFHRLDKDTSGVVLMGKRAEIGEKMSRMLEEKRIRKAYFAVVAGIWKKDWNRVEGNLARGEKGPNGIRRRWFRPEIDDDFSSLEIGRRSQLDRSDAEDGDARTRFAFTARPKGCSILGDPIYGQADSSAVGSSSARAQS